MKILCHLRYWETLAHLTKASIGSGLFAMGDAFRNAGLVAGLALTLFIGVVCVYAQHQLVRLNYRDKLSIDVDSTVESRWKYPSNERGKKMLIGSVSTEGGITRVMLCSNFIISFTNIEHYS